MESIPIIKEEYIISATIAVVLKRLLSSGEIDIREIYLCILSEASLEVDAPSIRGEMDARFKSKLDTWVLKYLTLRN